MGAVVGDLLPLAAVITLSPVPIIAVVLILLSANARVNSLTFMLGWMAGILLAIAVTTWLATFIPERDTSEPTRTAGAIIILLGAGLLVLAFRKWGKRTMEGEEGTLPSWMASIDSVNAGRAFGFGLALAALNPKNLLLSASAGVMIGSSDLDTGVSIVAIVIFTLLSSVTVVIPVIAYLTAPTRMKQPLESTRVWLTANNTVLMAALMLVIGLMVIGKGLGKL